MVTAAELKKWITHLPQPPELTTAYDEVEIETSHQYLTSQAKSLALNYYWPKWDSPWWHMAILYEMGLAHRIPRSAREWMITSIQQLLPIFFRTDLRPGRDPILNAPCPCSLGNIYQILSAAGADVDTALPWARSWFLRYQMPNGGSWVRREQATTFPLLLRVSEIGQPSPTMTAKWNECKQLKDRLIDKGLIA